MKEKILTTEQVASILQVHPFTILKFIKQGKLKGIKLGRVYRIKESDVEAFIEERTTGGRSAKKEPTKTPPLENRITPQRHELDSNSIEPERLIPQKIEGDSDHYYII